jgi:ABC-2 type transport system ATP-binding protein
VGVDLQAREAIAEALRRLKGDGVGVLLVTHDLEQAQRLADRVGFLRDGEKVLEGAPDALIAEAFGDRMEVEIDVVEPAPEAVLAAEGLVRADGSGAWVCLAADGYGLAGSIAARLNAKGVEVAEVRVRRPSLSQLFARVVEPGRAA